MSFLAVAEKKATENPWTNRKGNSITHMRYE